MKAITATIRGGDKVMKILRAMNRNLRAASALRVGFLEGATYPDGTPVATVAFWDEFGTKTSPPRPFLRNTIAEQSDKWGKAVGKIAPTVKYDALKTLTLLGEGIKGDIVDAIVKFDDPANAASTVAKKGFDKPLIDKGVMVRSVDYEVDL